jgi:hypothetical protein
MEGPSFWSLRVGDPCNPIILGRDTARVDPLATYETVTFVNEAETERFVCAICTHVVFEPRNQECGHVHCYACLDRAMLRSECCPQCRDPLLPMHKLPLNGFVKREIQQLRIKCPLEAHGCRWEGTLGVNDRCLLEHLSNGCEYHKIRCEACQKDVPSNKVTCHPEECIRRLVHCDACDTKMTYTKYIHHRDKLVCVDNAPCTGSMLCPDCCLIVPKSSRLAPHRAFMLAHSAVCPSRLQSCTICHVLIRKNDMPLHFRSHCQGQVMHRNVLSWVQSITRTR